MLSDKGDTTGTIDHLSVHGGEGDSINVIAGGSQLTFVGPVPTFAFQAVGDKELFSPGVEDFQLE